MSSTDQPSHTIKVKLPINLVGDAILVFETPDAVSPGGHEKRTLGITVNEAILSYVR